MQFNETHFQHPQKAIERHAFAQQLKSELGIDENDCYESAGLQKPYLADHAACARVLSKAFDLFRDMGQGKHQYRRPDGQGFMEEACSIESKEDFLTELKSIFV